MPGTPLERAPDPDLGHAPIPKERYTSRAVRRSSSGSACGRACGCSPAARPTCPSPGDYFTFEIGPESVLVVRQRDGSLAARYNVCMHRGNRLREPGRGHAERFALPRSTAGSTSSTARCAARSTRSASRRACPPSGSRLRPRALRDLGGLRVRVPRPGRRAAARLPRRRSPSTSTRTTSRSGRSLTTSRSRSPCNWKTSVDAFNEAYHISATHAWTLEFSDDVNTRLRLLRAPHAHDLPRGAGEPAPPGRRHGDAGHRATCS